MPKWKELKRFCENDGWILYKETDCCFYRKILPDGSVLTTKVSKGSKEISKTLWQQIHKKQIKTTPEEFNKKI